MSRLMPQYGEIGWVNQSFVWLKIRSFCSEQPDFWKNPVTAFKKAYRDTDGDILENVVGARGGSTAVTAILIDQKLLVVANVGDSRAVLIQRGKVKQITVDHEPEKKEERDLVESKGGFVIKMPGMIPLFSSRFLDCCIEFACDF